MSPYSSVDFVVCLQFKARGVTSQKTANLVNKCDTSKEREEHESMELRKIIRTNKHKNRNCRKRHRSGPRTCNPDKFQGLPGSKRYQSHVI